MKRIFIISYSHIASDARVLRQLTWLEGRYEITTFGYGDRPDGNFECHRLATRESPNRLKGAIEIIGGLFDFFHSGRFSVEATSSLLSAASGEKFPELVIVSDIDSMPADLSAFGRNIRSLQVLLDLHE